MTSNYFWRRGQWLGNVPRDDDTADAVVFDLLKRLEGFNLTGNELTNIENVLRVSFSSGVQYGKFLANLTKESA